MRDKRRIWVALIVMILITSMYTGCDNFMVLMEGGIITFHSQGGTEIPEQEAIGYIMEPEAPSRTGYVFQGWFCDEACTRAWDFEQDMIEGDMDLYAGWEIQRFSIRYDPNGADHGTTPEAQTKTYDVSIDLRFNTGGLSKDGFSYLGWNTESDGSGIDYAEGATYEQNSGLVLFAKWSENHSVTYHANGAESGDVPAEQIKVYGETLTLATNSGSLGITGYTFNGWNTQADNGGTGYAAGSTYSEEQDLDLYAVWRPNTDTSYTVKHYTQASYSSSSYQLQSTENLYGETATTATAVAKSYTGYEVNTTHPSTQESGTIVADGSLVLSLYYDVITHTVSYDDNEADSGDTPDDQIKVYGQNLQLSSNSGNLQKTGYTFMGWNTQADGNGTDYDGGDYYTTEEDLTLYAKWQIPYTITYDANGADSGTAPDDQTKLHDVNVYLSGPNGLEKEGHQLTGWNTESDGSGSHHDLYAFYSTNGDVTLFAEWTQTYTITYDANGADTGTAPDDQTKLHGRNITVEEKGDLALTNYSFEGWNTEADGSGVTYAAESTYTLNADLSLYAIWELDNDQLFEYTVYSDHITITKYIGTLKEVTVPDTIQDRPVTHIGASAFKTNTNITSVTISDNVTEIGNMVFMGCQNLESLALPENLSTIPYAMCEGCISLTDITIPDTVTTMDSRAFYNCRSLTEMTIPDSVTTLGRDMFYGCKLTNLVIGSGVTEIPDYFFAGGGNIGTLTIGTNVETIGDHAFDQVQFGEFNEYGTVSDYGTVTIPDSVTTIGEAAFNGAYMSTVTLGSGVTEIGDEAFLGSSSGMGSKLTSINFPEGLVTLGEGAFKCNGLLTSIDLPSTLTEMGNYCFQSCVGLTSITIPDSITSIPRQAFSGCTNLTSVTLLDGLQSIGTGAFSECSLSSISIPDSVTSIANSAFSYNRSLTSITIPDGITVIAENLLGGCESLTSVTLPSTVTSIKNGAFRSCKELTSINLPDSITEIGMFAFQDAWRLESIDLPASLVTIGQRAFYYNVALTAVTFGAQLTTIGDEAFRECRTLSSPITLPDSVQSIGTHAFYRSISTTISIGSGITYIGFQAFYPYTSEGHVERNVYIDLPSEPDGWDDNWDYGVHEVYWGSTGP